MVLSYYNIGVLYIHVLVELQINREAEASGTDPTDPSSIRFNPIQSNPIQSNPIQSNPIQSDPIQSQSGSI